MSIPALARRAGGLGLVALARLFAPPRTTAAMRRLPEAADSRIDAIGDALALPESQRAWLRRHRAAHTTHRGLILAPRDHAIAARFADGLPHSDGDEPSVIGADGRYAVCRLGQLETVGEGAQLPRPAGTLRWAIADALRARAAGLTGHGRA